MYKNQNKFLLIQLSSTFKTFIYMHITLLADSRDKTFLA